MIFNYNYLIKCGLNLDGSYKPSRFAPRLSFNPDTNLFTLNFASLKSSDFLLSFSFSSLSQLKSHPRTTHIIQNFKISTTILNHVARFPNKTFFLKPNKNALLFFRTIL